MIVEEIIEDPTGMVLGARTTDGSLVLLAPEDQIPRAQLATDARHLAEKYGVALPANPAIPPETMPEPAP
jgi:hypothetical protein